MARVKPYRSTKSEKPGGNTAAPGAVNPCDARIQRGEHPHSTDLADMLRSGMRISQRARDYIADRIEGKVKLPRGRLRSWREKRDAADLWMRCAWAYEDVKRIRRVRRLRYPKARAAMDPIEWAAKKHGLIPAQLRQWIKDGRYEPLRTKARQAKKVRSK